MGDIFTDMRTVVNNNLDPLKWHKFMLVLFTRE
jgi:hypothetical protein